MNAPKPMKVVKQIQTKRGPLDLVSLEDAERYASDRAREAVLAIVDPGRAEGFLVVLANEAYLAQHPKEPPLKRSAR